ETVRTSTPLLAMSSMICSKLDCRYSESSSASESTTLWNTRISQSPPVIASWTRCDTSDGEVVLTTTIARSLYGSDGGSVSLGPAAVLAVLKYFWTRDLSSSSSNSP